MCNYDQLTTHSLFWYSMIHHLWRYPFTNNILYFSFLIVGEYMFDCPLARVNQILKMKKLENVVFTTLSSRRKQGMRESNSRQRFWRPLSYHLTNPLCDMVFKTTSVIICDRWMCVKAFFNNLLNAFVVRLFAYFV